MKTLKRIVAAMLLMTVLVLSLASCNGGGGNNNNPIASDGKIDSKYINEKSSIYYWTGTGGGKNFDVITKATIEEYENWHRIMYFYIDFLNYSEIENKPLKKVKFDIVADRNVAVYFSCGYDGYNSPIVANVSLVANQKKSVELPLDLKVNPSDAVTVYFMRTAQGEKGQGYTTSAFAEWYQTQYKITNIECYSK